MPYHIITQLSYDRRPRTCGLPDCDAHCAAENPPEHIQDHILAICRVELVRHQDRYCALGIAQLQWDYDWCPQCLMRVLWTGPEVETIRQKELLSNPSPCESMEPPMVLDAMEFMAATDALPEWERKPRMNAALADARQNNLDEYPPGAAQWLRELREHIDRRGPEPAYWPIYKRIPEEQTLS